MNENGGLKEWVRDIDKKLDKLVESVTRIEVHNSRDSDRLDIHAERIASLESVIQEFAKEHQFVRGQLKMLMILGGALVGVAIIAEVVLLVMK